MPRFVARPVVVEAYCWDGNSVGWPEDFRLVLATTPDGRAMVQTADGVSVAKRDDWIVRGGDGMFVVVKAATFETTYGEMAAAEMPAKRSYTRRNDTHD